jgi:hypothetical protein
MSAVFQQCLDQEIKRIYVEDYNMDGSECLELGKSHTPTSSGAAAHPTNEHLGRGVAGTLANGKTGGTGLEPRMPSVDGGGERHEIFFGPQSGLLCGRAPEVRLNLKECQGSEGYPGV